MVLLNFRKLTRLPIGMLNGRVLPEMGPLKPMTGPEPLLLGSEVVTGQIQEISSLN